MPPGADDRGQAGDGPDGHPAAAVPLHAVVQPDQRRLLAGQAAREGLDGRDVDPGDGGDPFRRILLERTPAELPAPTVARLRYSSSWSPSRQMTCISPSARAASVPGRGAMCQSERLAVGSGKDRRSRSSRRALAGLDHQAPEMAVGVDRVRAPVDDELARGTASGSAPMRPRPTVYS